MDRSFTRMALKEIFLNIIDFMALCFLAKGKTRQGKYRENIIPFYIQGIAF